MSGFLLSVGAVSGFPTSLSSIGVNHSGSGIPGRTSVLGVDYIFPTLVQLQYWHGKGITYVRLPVRWERMQRALYGALDAVEVGQVRQTADYCRSLGMGIIIAPFQQSGGAGYDAVKIGSAGVPATAFADFWQRIASEFVDHAGVAGYCLLNEPNGHVSTGNVVAEEWPAVAQSAVDAIRVVDTRSTVFVEGLGYSACHTWTDYNDDMIITDTAGKLVYSAHQYFDKDNTGGYPLTYAQELALDGSLATRGADRVAVFAAWCAANGVRGTVSELGVPNDAGWLAVLSGALSYCASHALPVGAWAVGGINGSAGAALTLEPTDGVDAPQLATWLAKRSTLPRLAL